MSKNPHIGSTLDDFLREEGIFEDATNYAIKRVLAWQVEKAMRDQGITKVEMARRMGTSRAHLNRLLDPENDKVRTRHRAKSRRGYRAQGADGAGVDGAPAFGSNPKSQTGDLGARPVPRIKCVADPHRGPVH